MNPLLDQQLHILPHLTSIVKYQPHFTVQSFEGCFEALDRISVRVQSTLDVALVWDATYVDGLDPARMASRNLAV